MKTIITILILSICIVIAGLLFKSPRIMGIGCGAVIVTIFNFFFWGYMAWQDFDKKKGISFYKSLHKTF